LRAKKDLSLPEGLWFFGQKNMSVFSIPPDIRKIPADDEIPKHTAADIYLASFFWK
jgi:hypothetical protein